MNLPNKLTIMRIVLVPVYVACHLISGGEGYLKWLALLLFVIASITDTFDGYLARRKNLVTDFGKFLDPLADKMLVCSSLVCLVDLRRLPSWVCIVIIVRDFIISGVRLVASEHGMVIAASSWGKLKTTMQMIMIIFLMADLGGYFVYVEQVLIYLAIALTIISLIDYIIKNRDILNMQS